MHSPAMGFTEDVLQGLRHAHKAKFGGVTSAMAKAAEYDPTNLGRVLRGEKTKWLNSLGKLVDTSGMVIVAEEDAKGPEFAFIPRALARPAAGGGSLETTGETEGVLAFKRTWLAHKTTTNPNCLRVMEVVDDCMEPVINPGDIVLVDEGASGKELKEDRVYIIRKGEEIFIKRLKKAPGKLIFAGDNKDRQYKNVEVFPDDEDGFTIIGRVLWAGKEF